MSYLRDRSYNLLVNTLTVNSFQLCMVLIFFTFIVFLAVFSRQRNLDKVAIQAQDHERMSAQQSIDRDLYRADIDWFFSVSVILVLKPGLFPVASVRKRLFLISFNFFNLIFYSRSLFVRLSFKVLNLLP